MFMSNCENSCVRELMRFLNVTTTFICVYSCKLVGGGCPLSSTLAALLINTIPPSPLPTIWGPLSPVHWQPPGVGGGGGGGDSINQEGPI